MITHDANQQDHTQPECFLCTLDPNKQPCHEAVLEGRIVTALERLIDGERTPIILLDTGTQLLEILLDHNYYRSLIREIKARGDVILKYSLTLRLYHLPTLPQVIEARGRTRLRYTANAYTLAVLEPDLLLNITDLNQAEYCARQYSLKRLIPSSISPATIRGNLVHHCFKELLKEHDRGKFNPQTHTQSSILSTELAAQPETALRALYRHLDEALDLNSVDMALADVSNDTMRSDVAPHLESLAQWYETERNTLWDMPAHYGLTDGDVGEQHSGNQVRAETFLLAPEIGLRGRLDLFWQQSGRQRLLELKTGGAKGQLPKQEHRWQVYGYHSLLTVRRNSKMKKALATLLYSGTPDRAQAFGIPATIREIQRVNERRNVLILGRVTNQPPAPPGPSRCTKCAMLTQCQTISTLLAWAPPEPDLTVIQPQHAIAHDNTLPPTSKPAIISTAADRSFFMKYYDLLQLEGREGEKQQALLWNTPTHARIALGMAILGLTLFHKPIIAKDGWLQTFGCNNTSELREGDEILLSNGDPIAGEVVSGTIMDISSEQITIWTRELISHPMLVDRYDNDLVHVRTLQNLLRWQYAPLHLRDLVAGNVRPRFLEEHVSIRADFNDEQNLAVERAIQMQDYLLIHGPPGTGKTSVIAEIVKRLTQQGQRVMLVAFTNQAVDNMLKRLANEGFHSYLRLGHDRSVDATIRPRLLKALIDASRYPNTLPGDQCLETANDSQIATTAFSASATVRDILYNMPVVASTTATWSSDKYSPRSQHESADFANTSLSFDVAIIDEAGQLTIPAILGALRFAKRFILVGDEKQLPPLVLSKEASDQGLSDSLFNSLKRADDDYMQDHPLAISSCVPLRVQYRMNKWIANFSSRVFYDNLLLAHPSVANRYLHYQPLQHALLNEDATITTILKPEWPLAFVAVHDQDASPESKMSDAEALVVRDLVAGLLARGISQKDIGIIAPYRAQVANIRRHLFKADHSSGWSGLPLTTPLSVDTVDRFQGGERMIIIISFATSHEPPFASPRRDFLSNGNRLNVALTRAQRKLILVGQVTALEPLPTFNRLIAYCRSMHTLIAAHAKNVVPSHTDLKVH